jgi:excalibur calcium-binding domain-containing protein
VGDEALPPVEEYPGWFPPKAPIWTRTTVGLLTGVGGALVGLFLGLVVGLAGSSGAPEPARAAASTSATVTVTPTPTPSAGTMAENGAADVAAAQVEADHRVAALRSRQVTRLSAVRQSAKRHLRAVVAAAERTRRRAVAQAVSQAVARERRRADDRVAAAKAAARSVAAAPSTDPRFDYCYEANAAEYGPYFQGRDPEYDWYRDGDGDGEVCE